MAQILVIDDDLDMQNMLIQMMQRAGHEADGATNGKEGLALCSDKKYDIIITDIIMPEKDGLETLMEFKKTKEDVQIIAISGGGRIGPDSYLNIAAKLGAKYTFTKPLERKALLDAVEDLLGSSEAHHRN